MLKRSVNSDLLSGKKLFLILLTTFSWSFGFSQNTLKVIGDNLKVTGSTHIVLNNTDFINQGNFEAPAATITFSGTASNILRSGGAAFYNLKIDKSNGKIVRLKDDLLITNQLEFAANGNTLEVDMSDLVIGVSANITGYSSSRYVVTDSTGRFVKKDMSTFTFPIGFDASSYNPLTLTENGTIDTIGIRCLEHVLDGGDSGNPLPSGVANASWELTESVSGGSTFSTTAQWTTADELSNFSNTDCGIMRYHSGDWDLPVTAMSTAFGSNPFTQTGTVSDVGVIAVGGDSLINRIQLAARVFFQGPFIGTQMTDNLRSKALIPLTEPFTGLGYSHQGRGGGETIENSVLDVTGEDAITDWVVIELRDKNASSSVLETFSALIQRDGDIVGLDGISDAGLPVLDDYYFVAVRHRNHLGIRTPSVENLEEASSTIYDFTTASGQAHGTNPMAEVSTGVWGMWGGNTTGDYMVRATGPPTINDYSNLLNYLGGPTNIITDVYVSQDINMDGNVRATGPPTINDYAKLLNILGGAINIIFEQL
jgi:hypothetical protein